MNQINWFERAIAAVSPKWAVNRMAARSTWDVLSGGRLDRRRSGVQTNADSAATEWDLAKLREIHYDADRQNCIAESIFDAAVRGVLAESWSLQAKSPDEGFSNDAEEYFAMWSQECDVTGRLDFHDVLRLSFRELLLGGDVFVNKVGGKVELINADRVLSPLGSKKNVVNGVELDESGKPLRYYVSKYDTLTGMLRMDDAVQLPASDVLHVMQYKRIGQTRGIPALSSAVKFFDSVPDFVEAVLVAARIAACLTAFVISNDPVGLTRSLAQPESSQDGIREIGKFKPGMIMSLGKASDVKMNQPTQPATNFDQFVLTIGRLICAPLGVAVENALFNPASASYSALRSVNVESEQAAKKWRHIVSKLIHSIWDWQLGYAVDSGALKAPSGMGDDRREWFAMRAIPSRKPYLDPSRDWSATSAAVEANLKTWAEAYADRGEDWRGAIAERANEIRFALDAAENAGISPEYLLKPKAGVVNESTK